MSHTVEFTDRDVSVEASDGETILKAILNAGEEYMHACGGFCNCTTCRVKIEKGMENISEMQQDEKNTLRRFQGDEILDGPFRLSCQAKIHGDIEISEPDWY